MSSVVTGTSESEVDISDSAIGPKNDSIPTGTSTTTAARTATDDLKLQVLKQGARSIVKLTPPQTNNGSAQVKPTRGAHCLVLDISYSMDTAATVTNDDGDKVTHGFSLLDVVKHACCTYVASLDEHDWLQVVVYSDVASVARVWTKCTDDGKKLLDQTIRDLKTTGATNLRDGIQLGMSAFEQLPDEVAAAPNEFAMLLGVCTDGLPSSGFHPSGGETGYAKFTNSLKKQIVERYGPTALPTIAAIGFGNQLNSILLDSFSDIFLHIPDPGSVGPFIVNLVAATRCTAKLSDPTNAGAPLVANKVRMIIEPASSVISVPGYVTKPWRGGAAVAVQLGNLLYDTPRHINLVTNSPSDVQITVEVAGREIAHHEGSVEVDEADPVFKAQIDRTDVLCGLLAAQPTSGTSGSVGNTEPLKRCMQTIAAGPLKETLAAEMLLAVEDEKFRTWGRHYLMTLPIMLRLERRSNFRDACLQMYGKDARGAEALFEEISNATELVFATLKPPTPSKIASQARTSTAGGGGGGGAIASMPAEFMRGGGCFSPGSVIDVCDPYDGQLVQKQAAEIVAGDMVRVADGSFARVTCVVLSPCKDDLAHLARVGPKLLLTPWHPVLLRGAWHFPALVGVPVKLGASHVVNFVLDRSHVLMVDGVPCVTLGHGLQAPVAKHDFWGTSAVIEVLRQCDGWERGRVVLDNPLRA